MRLLFLTPNPVEAAGTRYRVLQYIPYLQSHGIECNLIPFLNSSEFGLVYRRGEYAKKAISLTLAALRRLKTVLIAGRYDAIFIAREAMLFGPPVIEWLMTNVINKPVIFDFDDAIFVSYISPTHGRIATRLKFTSKSDQLMTMSSQIIAGNEYLANYARKFNDRVTVIPTVVDTEQYSKKTISNKRNVIPVIGWIGTHSTAQYLDIVFPALEDLSRRHKFIFRVIGAGRQIVIPGVTVENRQWKLETEVEDFQSLDIGLYPIRKDDWSIGKCAFKAIQYMAAEVPSVSSPVGMTTQVVENGGNGLLADSTERWIEAIERLLIDESLCRLLASVGRRTIEERYSLKVHAPRFMDVLRQVS